MDVRRQWILQQRKPDGAAIQHRNSIVDGELALVTARHQQQQLVTYLPSRAVQNAQEFLLTFHSNYIHMLHRF